MYKQSWSFCNWWSILVNLLRWNLHASLLADGPGQVALDIWLFLFVCLYVFFVFFLSSICKCLLVFLVFVFLVFLWWCQLVSRWFWTASSSYLVGRFFFSCLFLNVFLFVSLPVFMCWLFLLVFLCWWNLRACLLVDDFGQTVFRGCV